MKYIQGLLESLPESVVCGRYKARPIHSGSSPGINRKQLPGYLSIQEIQVNTITQITIIKQVNII